MSTPMRNRFRAAALFVAPVAFLGLAVYHPWLPNPGAEVETFERSSGHQHQDQAASVVVGPGVVDGVQVRRHPQVLLALGPRQGRLYV
jgi:hypothetical protein